MTKSQLFHEIKQSLEDNELTLQELQDWISDYQHTSEIGGVDLGSRDQEPSPTPQDSGDIFQSKFGKILTILGALVILIGIVSFISLIWEDIPRIGEIILTLGVGIGVFSLANFLLSQQKLQFIALSLHVIPPFLIPFGVQLTLDEIFPSNVSDSAMFFTFAMIFSVMALLYGVVDYLYRKQWLTFLAWIFGTMAYSAFVSWMIVFTDTARIWFDESFRLVLIFPLIYTGVVAGVLYLLSPLKKGFFNKVVTFLITGIGLGSVLSFTADRPILDALYVFVLLGVLAGVIRLRSMPAVVATLIMSVGYIFYLNSNYFADVLGWPIALIIIGMSLLGAGYGFMQIKQNL